MTKRGVVQELEFVAGTGGWFEIDGTDWKDILFRNVWKRLCTGEGSVERKLSSSFLSYVWTVNSRDFSCFWRARCTFQLLFTLSPSTEVALVNASASWGELEILGLIRYTKRKW